MCDYHVVEEVENSLKYFRVDCALSASVEDYCDYIQDASLIQHLDHVLSA